MKREMQSLRKGILVALPLLLTIAGCSKGGTPSTSSDTTPKPTSNDPITLKIGWSGAEADAKKSTDDPYITSHMPNVTFEYHSVGKELAQMVAANDAPDLINVNSDYLAQIKSLGLQYDASDLIKKEKFDMSRFSANQLDTIKAYGEKGELYALPQGTANSTKYTPWAIVYNKDIFDKFAVPYPKDGLKWDEVIDLAKRFDRTDGGVQYKGLDIYDGAVNMATQLALSYNDKNGKVDLSNPKWMDVLRLYKRAFQDQGNYLPEENGLITGTFMKEKNVAMNAGNQGSLFTNAEKYEGQLNWDIASYPSFDGNRIVPGKMGVWVITSTSKHKEAALQFINLMNSDTMLKTSLERWENPVFMKKNFKAVMNTQNSLFVGDAYTVKMSGTFRSQAIEMLNKNKDLNTALHDTQDELQKTMDGEKNK